MLCSYGEVIANHLCMLVHMVAIFYKLLAIAIRTFLYDY